MRNIATILGLLRFLEKLICCIAFGSASSCLLKSIAINL